MLKLFSFLQALVIITTPETVDMVHQETARGYVFCDSQFTLDLLDF